MRKELTEKSLKRKRHSRKEGVGLLKKGVFAQCTTKKLYLLPDVTLDRIIHQHHANSYGFAVHEICKESYLSAFSAHISKDIKEFVHNCEGDRLSVPQIMSKHLNLYSSRKLRREIFGQNVFIDAERHS